MKTMKRLLLMIALLLSLSGCLTIQKASIIPEPPTPPFGIPDKIDRFNNNDGYVSITYIYFCHEGKYISVEYFYHLETWNKSIYTGNCVKKINYFMEWK